MYLKLSVLIFYVTLGSIESAKILAVYPTPSISHQVVFRKITNELVKIGHEVTVVTPNPEFSKNRAPKNLTEIDIHDISYQMMYKYLSTRTPEENLNIFSDARLLYMIGVQVFETQLQVPEVNDLLFGKKRHFDLILIEEVIRAALAITHVFPQTPVVLISSLGASYDILDSLGALTHPTLYPAFMQKRLFDLTLWEKIVALYKHYTWLNSYYSAEGYANEVLQKHFGSDMPPIRQLYKNVDMVFMNIHPVWANNQPVPPNVIYLGGLHQIESKELPKDLQNYLDSSKHGVIYVSFGTNALSTLLPLDKIEIIAKVLGQLPYDVLWKWDADELPGRTKNIKLSKWLPQADLLKHPKIKLFITQAGLQSTDEAITAGVPLIAFPALGDQWYNAEQYVHHGIGKKILFKDVAEDTVKNAIERVIIDESYRKNIRKLRDVMNDQPQKPLDTAIFWIEHIIRHKGGKHLRAAGANLSWADYFESNVLLFSLSLCFILIALLSFSFYYVYRFVSNNFLYQSHKLKKN